MHVSALKTTSTVVAVCAALALTLTACGEENDRTATTPTATSSVAANSEAALRARLIEFYSTIAQKREWKKAFDYLSPRCQKLTNREALAAGAEEAYGEKSGRDFSGEPTYTVTMNGDAATVVVKAYDGKGTGQPQKWAFADGMWSLDNC